jgi:hypothetical protein
MRHTDLHEEYDDAKYCVVQTRIYDDNAADEIECADKFETNSDEEICGIVGVVWCTGVG